MPACKVCSDPEHDRIEAVGRQALSGALSWRRASAMTGIRPESLKNHMENHVVAPALAEAEREATDELDALIEQATAELKEQFYMAPPDVKPLILVAIKNLEGLHDIKPSQKDLITALKTIQEMTGMKNEQRMLLAFADAMFKKPQQVESTATPVLELTEES